MGVLRSTYLPRFFARRAERKVRHHAAQMHGIADEIIAQRRAEGLGHRDDLLEIMLGSDLDAANIRYQMINFLVAGHETTSGALSFALYFLSRHPEVFARARTEIDDVWGAVERPESEQIGKLRYVRRVLDESLRLQPTVPGYYRAAREDTLLAGEYPMRKGDWVLALTPLCTAIHAGAPTRTSSIPTGSRRIGSRRDRATCTSLSEPAKGRASDGNSRCTRRCSSWAC